MSVARSSAIMAAGSVASRILGVLRQALITYLIGQGLVGNAFTTANTLPNIIYMLIAGGVLNSVLVPQLVKAADAKDGGRDYTDRLLTVGIGGILLVTLVATAASALLVRLYAGDRLEGAALELAVFFAVLTLPQIFFYGLYGLLGQVLNARGQFAAYGWAPALANAVAIVGLLAFAALYDGHRSPSEWTSGMVWLFAGTATASIAAQGLLLVWPLWRSGFRWRPRFGLRGSGLGTTSRIAGWAFGALAVSQLGYLVASQVMWRATGGSEHAPVGGPFVAGTTVYANSLLVFMVPHGLVTVSVLTALYPRLSAAARKRDLIALRTDYLRGLTVPAVLTLPATAALMVFALPLAGLLFTSANPAELPATAAVLAGLAPALLPFGVDLLSQRMWYAFEDGRMGFLEQSISTVAAIAVSLCGLLVAPENAVAVIALGVVAGNVVGAAFGVLMLRRKRLGNWSLHLVVRSWVRMAVASTGAGWFTWGLVIWLGRLTAGWGRIGYAVTLLVGGAVLGGLYIYLARRLRIHEIDTYLEPNADRLSRGRPGGKHRGGIPKPPTPPLG